MLKIKSLYSYPVKSCAGIEHEITELGAFGLQNDRQWMIVDSNGNMITQRKVHRMCLIKVVNDAQGIVLSIPGKEIHVPIPVTDKTLQVKVWNDYCEALDTGDEVATWLEEFLNLPCRLVYFPADGFRQVDLEYAQPGDKTAFSDGFPLLLISQASLDDLNSRLQSSISIQRFRPNIVVQGCEPYAEDSWKKIEINGITFRLVKPCSRCIIPSINPDTGERENEPLQTLKTYRQKNNKIYFGQNVIADSGGELSRGMTVTLLE